MPGHVVAKAEDLPPGGRLRVVVEGRAILVLNIKGELFALTDTCPHRGASLSGGVLTGLVSSTAPGDVRYERAGEILRCPWHQWEFDVRTGRSYCDPKRWRLQSYPVGIEGADGAVRVEGDLRAETFPIERRGGDIVVDVT